MGWARTLLLGGSDVTVAARAEPSLAQTGGQLRATGTFDREVERRLDALAAENAQLQRALAGVVRVLRAKGAVAAEELETLAEELEASGPLSPTPGSATSPLPPLLPAPRV